MVVRARKTFLTPRPVAKTPHVCRCGCERIVEPKAGPGRPKKFATPECLRNYWSDAARNARLGLELRGRPISRAKGYRELELDDLSTAAIEAKLARLDKARRSA